ncbi:YciI family protein [Microbacterium sp. CIAB417]|uniref:YciI family protein n=1 Tax=Microbacterium sp. CIAB417 TaxID=2860287 RepID=UPI001FAC7F4A|nr:YciI family protein [Microbacterium sp. CIAB417]
MKYVLMFASTPALDAEVDVGVADAVYQRIYDWFAANSAVIVSGGAELQPVVTATTIRAAEGRPLVVDGPFSEAKEVIGGFSIIDVPDLDAAIALAKTWPVLDLPGTSLEIRPAVEDYSRFEDDGGSAPVNGSESGQGRAGLAG